MSSISAGTTSTTTLVHSGDTTGSLVFKTNDTGSGGTTAVTIDTSQNVGIGVTPASWYSNRKAIQVSTGVAIAGSGNSVDYGFFGTNYYDASGAGTSTYIGSGKAARYEQSAGVHAWSTAGTGTAGNAISFTESMRIDSSGNLLVGITSAYGTECFGGYRNGTAVFQFDRGGSDGTLGVFRRSGSVVGSITVTTTATAYNTSSDYRLKEKIAPMTGALAKVALLKPVTYKWKADGSDGEGFIAHELAEVKPDCVSGVKDAVDANGNPVYQGIDTSFLVATLTAALQEAHGLIKDLQTRVAILEAK